MPLKILIVEDTLETRQLIHHYFKTEGYDVPTAADGEEGLYKAKAEKPDLIITDVDMPTLNGLEMIKKIRSDPEIARTPILVFTGGATDIEEVLEAGANKVCFKPFDFEELREIAREMLFQTNDESLQYEMA
jgi:DNA-binding response OmpR family regulator